MIYKAPQQVEITTLRDLISRTKRSLPSVPAQQGLPFDERAFSDKWDRPLWIAGDRSIISAPAVAIVGTRKVTQEGAARARRLARALANAGITVVSGLAAGVDTEALSAAIQAGGHVIAVIGTPLDKATPKTNSRLQQRIYEEHLLVSQFPSTSRVFPSNFPQRNRTMAAISDATVIIEASDTSGTLHQARECTLLGRWLFIASSCARDPSLTWPASFLKQPRTIELTVVEDVLKRVIAQA